LYSKPFPDDYVFKDADILIVGSVIPSNPLKDGFIIGSDNILLDDLFTLEEVRVISKKYGIKKIIVTHIEEDYGKSYDDYMELQKNFDKLEFAFDGMEIVL